MALERASLQEEMALRRPESQAGLGTQADWRGKGREGGHWGKGGGRASRWQQYETTQDEWQRS